MKRISFIFVLANLIVLKIYGASLSSIAALSGVDDPKTQDPPVVCQNRTSSSKVCIGEDFCICGIFIDRGSCLEQWPPALPSCKTVTPLDLVTACAFAQSLADAALPINCIPSDKCKSKGTTVSKTRADSCCTADDIRSCVPI